MNKKIDLVVLIALILVSLILMVNFDLRIADLHEDDGPIFYALAAVNPDMFAGDYLHGIPVELITPFQLFTSLLILFPGLIYKLTGLHPYFSTWVLTFLQIFSFGYTLYYFLITAGISRKMACLGMVFAYAAAMWGWSATYFESDFNGILSLSTRIACFPFLFLSISFFLKGKSTAGYILLLLTGLNHPTIALFAIGTLAIWRFFQTGFSGFKKLLPHLAVLFVISLVIAAPSFIVRKSLPFHSLPLDELIQGMKLNIHLYPWKFGLHWPPLQTTLIWLLMGLLGYQAFKKQNQLFTSLWIASLISSLIFSLSQILGALTNLTTLLDLVGLRAFSISIFLAFPIILNFFEENYFFRGYVFRLVAILTFLLPFLTVQYGLSWMLVVSLVLLILPDLGRIRQLTFLKHMNPRFTYLTACFLTGVFMLFFVLSGVISQIELSPLLDDLFTFFFEYPLINSNSVLLAVGMGIALLAAVPGRNFFVHLQKRWIQVSSDRVIESGSIILLILFFMMEVNIDRSPEALARLDVQKWAKTSTPVGSVFWVPGFNGWRGYSERRRVDNTTRENYAYIYAITEAKEYRMKVLRFYGLTEDASYLPMNTGLNEKETKLAEKFDTAKYRQLREKFNVTHIVLLRAEFIKPELPLIYQNDYYDVFEIIGG
ncbi:MAG: hypothetical protein GYA15_04545 [Leptolinea sp.]|jgi:hypothetical protein|nr:hypothetical protein [Leptolinea sp.]